MNFAQNSLSNSAQNEDVFANFSNLSQQQLLDTANYYFNKNNFDSALIYYNFITSSPAKDKDLEQQKRIIEAYLQLGIIYDILCDYRSSYEFFIKALLQSEKSNCDSFVLKYKDLERTILKKTITIKQVVTDDEI